ncbi:MAG: hypothetical protein Q9225_007142 [Loekoesia sp. 1 TL-2023]
MRAPPYIAASALLGLSLANSVHRHGHEELFHKRHNALFERNKLEPPQNSTCGCTTYWKTFYGEPTLIQPLEQNTTTTRASTVVQTSIHHITNAPEAPTITSSPAPINSTPTDAPKPATSVQAPSPKVAEPAPPAQESSPAAAPAKKPANKPLTSHTSSPIGASGSQWCMTYSPYTSAGGCKSSSDVTTDVTSIAQKGFSSIRIYSTDCNGLSAVASAASSYSINLILGVYISASGISAARPQIQEIISWANNNGHWQGVEMIVVGNEAVFNNFCTAEELASFVSEAKTAFQAAGYTGPITTTETIETLTEHKATLCPVSDVAAANIHPFFNGQISASQAGEFVASQLTLLESVCPGKAAYNLETGWPSKGSAHGAAIPGSWEQRVAIEGIRNAAGGKSAFFSFVDDEWKEEGEWGVERNFGCGQLFG